MPSGCRLTHAWDVRQCAFELRFIDNPFAKVSTVTSSGSLVAEAEGGTSGQRRNRQSQRVLLPTLWRLW